MPTRPVLRSLAHDRARSLNALRALVAVLGGSARAIESHTGLTNAQLFLLRQMADNDALSINELAALVHTRQNTVSSVVGRLVRLGMVRKTPTADDRRKVSIVLTPKGQRVLAKAPQSPTETLMNGIAALRPADTRTLAAGLAALVAALGIDADAAPLLFEEREMRDAG